MSSDRLETGRLGENHVAALLRERGFVVRARNARVGRYEIDIIATKEDELLVFCEVRTRRNDDFGAPAETVDAKKQDSLRRGAAGWLEAHAEYQGYEVRFDVAGVTLEPSLVVDYYVDAF